MNQVSSPLPKLLTIRSAPSERAVLRAVGYSLFIGLGAIVAYFSVATTFASQDDEGYALLSLKQFLSGGSLYHTVYSQYGPFPYELWGAVFKALGMTVTPNNGRIIVMILWLITSLLIGFTVERLTGSVLLGLIGALAGFAGDAGIVNEPMHPGGLAALLVIAILATVTLLPRRRSAQMALLGCLLAASVLTKINIGASAVLATLLALSATSPSLRRWRWSTAVLAGLGVLMPIVAMHKDLGITWAENFAALMALGAAGVGVCLTRWRTDRTVTDPARLDVLAGAFVGAVILIVLIIIALGTSLHDVVEGVLIRPLAQPDVATIPLVLPTLTVDIAVAGLVCALGSAATRRAGRPTLIPAIIRIVAGLLMWLWISGTMPFSVSPNPGTLGICIPLSWLALVPAGGPDVEYASWLTRAVLTTVPVLGAIVAYPVAGTPQVSFATVAFVPVAGLILADGLHALRRWTRARHDFDPGRFTHLVSLAAAGLLAVMTYQVLIQGAVNDRVTYRSLKPLPFAGATTLRQPPATVAALSEVVNTIRTHCDNFISQPGLDSFYFWSHTAPPTGLNPTSWMYLLNASEQQRVVNAVARIPRLCLIRNDSWLTFWITVAGGKPPLDRPLWAFTHSYFKPILSVGGYEVLIHGD